MTRGSGSRPDERLASRSSLKPRVVRLGDQRSASQIGERLRRRRARRRPVRARGSAERQCENGEDQAGDAFSDELL